MSQQREPPPPPLNPDRPADPARAAMRMAGAGGIALFCALVIGIVLYAVNREDRTASESSAAPTTIGQSQQTPAGKGK